MKAKWFAHLPSVGLETSKVPLGLGHVEQIPFDEWVKLDGTFYYNDRQYQSSKPVFYIGETEVPDETEGAVGQLNKQVDNEILILHRAFLLAPPWPLLPHPKMSVIYKFFETPMGLIRRREIGPFEREWIVFGSPNNYLFDMKMLSGVSSVFDSLKVFDLNKAFSGVEAGLNTLALTAFPEFWWAKRELNRVNDFVHCIAALENILLPPKDQAPEGMKLTPTFGKNAAVVVNSSRESIQNQAECFSDLYRLRSRLIHGEIGIEDLTDAERARLNSARILLGKAIVNLLTLRRFPDLNETLPQLLARAFDHANFQKDLFSKPNEDNSL